MASLDSDPGAELDLGGLVTGWLGQCGRSLHQVDSTNDLLLDWADRGAPHGAICVAREQHQGRGRQRRHWESPPGRGLYLSMLLRPRLGAAAMAPFSLVTALVTAEALEPLVGIHVGLKWPNDLMLDGRKLGGILVESRARDDASVVVGLGLNLRTSPGGWSAGLEGRAISLEEATGERLSRAQVLCAVLNALEPAYELFVESGLRPFVAAWSARSVLRGRRVRVQAGETQFMAEARDIDERGRLEVRPDNDGVRWLGAGEVHLQEA